MIRTLLVDDEPIVRKGLMHILPWEQHGMQVIADVGGGEQALRILQSERVNLLVTDLSMPGMSGFDLIARVQMEYPDIHIAVLMNQPNDEHIHKALNRGVLDYMVKSEHNEEKLDERFRQLAARLAIRTQWSVNTELRKWRGREMVLFVAMHDDCRVNELYQVPYVSDFELHKIKGRAWVMEAPGFPSHWDRAVSRHLCSSQLGARWMVIRLHHLGKRERLSELASSYLNRHMFYVAVEIEGGQVIHDSFRQIEQYKEMHKTHQWLDNWSTFEWISDHYEWKKLLDLIQSTRPNPAELCRELAETARAWKLILRNSTFASLIERMHTLNNWEEWKNWLTECRNEMRKGLDWDGLGKELIVSILRSIGIVQNRMDEHLTQKDLSSLIHLSRGYISGSFKRVIGMSFNEYMRALRVDKAHRLLAEGDMKVDEIARRCGFADECYFRKLFREETGMSVQAYMRLNCSISSYN